MLPNETALLERFGISKEDIDTCATSYLNMGLEPLYFIEDSLFGASKQDLITLEGLVKRRSEQIQKYLDSTTP